MVDLLFKLERHRLKSRLCVYSTVLLISLATIIAYRPVAYGDASTAHLFLTPPIHVAKEIDELFSVYVNISEVTNLYSAQFTVTYNPSLLHVQQVSQGAFFPSPPKSRFLFENNESLGFVKVNMTLEASEVPRNGKGTLANISFKVIQASTLSSPLNLQQTLLLNPSLTPITHDTAGAVYFWKTLQPDPPSGGRLLDLYTQKGGIGPNEPGGDFVLNETVHLISRATYDDQPVQKKLVAFQIINPLNETVATRTAISDSDGFAETFFVIPILPSSIGVWTVVSLVEISAESVWDTTTLHVYGLPVGGYSFSSRNSSTETTLAPYILFITMLMAVSITTKRLRFFRK